MLSFQQNLKRIPQNINIPVHIIVSSELNKFHGVDLLKITPYKICKVRKSVYAKFPYHK